MDTNARLQELRDNYKRLATTGRNNGLFDHPREQLRFAAWLELSRFVDQHFPGGTIQ